MEMDCSIIVCTRNSAGHLAACLSAIVAAMEAARPARCELVVVDNASSDATASTAAELLTRAEVSFDVLAEPRPGLSFARNAGLRRAAGALVAFTDDDCRMAPDYLVRALALHGRDDRPVLRGGRVELGDQDDLPFTVIRDREARRFDPGNVQNQIGGFILGCNMTAPRALFREVGPFDTRFGVGAPLKAAEDSDYLYRTHFSGFDIEYCPDLLIRHHHGRRDETAVQRVIDYYNEGEGALYAKYILRPRLFVNQLKWDLRDAVLELVLNRRDRYTFGVSKRRKILRTAVGFLRYAALSVRGSLAGRRAQAVVPDHG
ncbi:glycosyltransferase family 2 protein [Methylobacterium sp. A54F]